MILVHEKKLLQPISFLFIALFAINIVGCCGTKKISSKQKNNSSFAKSLNNTKDNKDKKQDSFEKNTNGVYIDISNEIQLRPQDERAKELYLKLDYANKMLKKKNYDGSLREIKRIQQSINNNPYLMTQTWALAAKVYDKMGNSSGRKRCYKKMMESLAMVYKDSRYTNAYNDGIQCQKLIALAEEKGGKKNDFQ